MHVPKRNASEHVPRLSLNHHLSEANSSIKALWIELVTMLGIRHWAVGFGVNLASTGN